MICTPHFPVEDANFRTLLHSKMKLLLCCWYSKNESTMRWRKYGEMASLMFNNPNKHVLLALGVDRTAKNTVKAKFTAVQSMFPCYIGLVWYRTEMGPDSLDFDCLQHAKMARKGLWRSLPMQ